MTLGHGLVRPRNEFEARKWSYYTLQDWYPIIYWPDRIKTIALKIHKNYQDRMNMMLFLLYNGLPPDRVREYMMFMDHYDSSALQQMNHIERNFRNYRYEYFDMVEERVIRNYGEEG